MKTKASILAIAFVAACGTLWLLRSREAGVAPAQSGEPLVEGQGHVVEPLSTGREAAVADSPYLLGKTVAADGQPLSAVLVRWRARLPVETDVRPTWGRVGLLNGLPELPLETPARKTVDVYSDARGAFAFSEAPEEKLDNGSFLVASVEGYRAIGLDLEPGNHGPVELRMEPGQDVIVRVVDSRGAAVTGATIHHVAGGDFSADDELHAYRRFLAETRLTDASGSAQFVEFPGREAFHAVLGEQRSTPWCGAEPSRVELRLSPTFRIAGAVWFPDREAGADVGEHSVEVAGRSGLSWRPLAVAREVAAEFGPILVPLLPGALEYRVRLDGPTVVPSEVFFDPPTAGELLRFDLRVEKGEAISLVIKDTTQRPIVGARGTATWIDANGRLGSKRGVSGPEGYLYLGSLPAGVARYQVSAPGFSDFANTTMVPLDSAPVVTLEKLTSLSGRVTLHESPVSDFEILYRRNDSLNQHARRAFYDREDGSFELSLGAGEWVLRAVSELQPASRPEFFRVTEGKENHVELRLTDPLLGGGIVMEASSGEPVAGARIQPLSGDGMDRTLVWGDSAESVADGSFELMAFTAGQNTIVVSADGFADAVATAQASDDGFVDWGEVRLSRPQPLEIRVRGCEELGLSPDAITVFSTKGFTLAPKPLDGGGVVVFEAVPPGELQLYVGRDAYFARMDLNLAPGGDWTFEVGLGGSHTVVARLFDEEGEPYSGSMWMLAGGNEFGHYVLRMDGTPEDYRFLLGGIGTEEVELVASADDGRVLASKVVDFDGKDHLEVDLRIETSPLLVRVIDTEGAPIPGASVRVRALDENRVLSVGKSSTDGECSLAGAPHAPVIVDLDHPEIGRRFGISIDASVRRHELVLAAGGRVTLNVRDGDEALANVETRLQTPGGTVLADPVITSSAGTATLAPLGAGAYHLYCTRSDAWPVLLVCSLGADEEKTVEVTLRRLAEVELVVVGSDGLPIAGVPVQVTSAEFAADVATWLGQEKISSDTGLVTNLSGRVRIEGLPHGAYGWSISLPEAESAGAFRIDPGKNIRTLMLSD